VVCTRRVFDTCCPSDPATRGVEQHSIPTGLLTCAVPLGFAPRASKLSTSAMSPLPAASQMALSSLLSIWRWRGDRGSGTSKGKQGTGQVP
jgi:hypothetical protein